MEKDKLEAYLDQATGYMRTMANTAQQQQQQHEVFALNRMSTIEPVTPEETQEHQDLWAKQELFRMFIAVGVPWRQALADAADAVEATRVDRLREAELRAKIQSVGPVFPPNFLPMFSPATPSGE